ncbi:MAG TPA: ABC transporter ATP-binding protein [Pirellulales bacterium]|nr:ABC transporter ATP-binding protein [Pirellulales bacterium]
MIRRLLAYRRLAGRDAACGALLLLMASAFELLQPWPIKGLVDYVFGNRPAPDWLARIWPAFARHDASGEALGVCLAILLLAVLHRLAATASQFLLVRAGWSLVHQLRCGVSDHVHRLSLAYHDRSKVGDSLYRIAYDSHAAQSLVTNALVPMGTAIVTLTGIVLIMLRLDVWLTLAAIAVMPVFWRLIHRFGQSIERHSQRYHEQESRLVSATQESLSSIRIVQAFTQEPVVAAAFHELGDGSRMTNQRLTAVQLLFSASVGLTMAAGTAIVVWLGSQAVLADRLSVGDILVFLAYLGMVYQPLNSLSQGTNVYHLAKAQLKRVFELLDAPVDVADRPGAVQPAEVRGRLELCEVDFGYSPGRAVLRGIDLTIEPGQVVGLVGRTGAGKSTLAALLLRFFDPESGKILLDGRDFRDLKLAWLRRQVSIVLQDAVLFSTTVAENIAVGRPDASREEIERAARQAQAEEFIRALPDGYDTPLGERGVNLSGGQRQRLAIARAFLKDAPILILDEPTSALDAKTEAALLESLELLMRGRTTVIIAHRLSTLERADVVVVLDEGRIVEQGGRDELLSRDSAFRRFYRNGANSRRHGAALAET